MNSVLELLLQRSAIKIISEQCICKKHDSLKFYLDRFMGKKSKIMDQTFFKVQI